MADSNPAKRRKLSPPINPPTDAPRSPSKLPIPIRPQSQDGTRSGSMPRRPSFASPTKASLARNNPQILDRLGPSGRYEAVNTDHGGTSVQASIEGGVDQNATRNPDVPQTPIQEDMNRLQGGQRDIQTQDQVQARGLRSAGGSMVSAPRRRSHTPGQVAAPTEFGRFHAEQMNEEELLAGPIRRPALRRSPPAGSQARSDSQSNSQPPRFSPTENPDTGTAANIGIVRKPALRRSPIAASQTTSQTTSQPRPQSRSAEKLDTSTAPIRKSALRRSPPPVSSQIVQTNTHPESTQFQPELELEPQPNLEPTAHSTPTHSRYHQVTDILEKSDEPELPPTPVQRGLEDPVVTTPPTGIHDTPSKRRKKRDNPMAKVTGTPSKSSPLKPQSKFQAQSLAPKPLPKYNVSRSTDASSSLEDQTPIQDEDIDMSGVSRHGPRPPPDKHAVKRRIRDKLLQELQQLQADVSLAESENERLFNLHESGNDMGVMAPNQSEIEELLKRSGYGDREDEEKMDEKDSPKPLNSFHALSSFLPFSAPLIRQLPPITTKDEEEPIPSHLPLEQENPLPYLQLFTPLQFSSIITVVPSSSDPDSSILSTSTSSSTEVLKDIIQSHTITATSPNSTSLFRSTVSILVNTTTFSIISLNVKSLSPVARPELGSFLTKISDEKDDVLAGNVATMFWAMGRWYEVARKRAIFWVRVEEEFGAQSKFATRARNVEASVEKAEPKKRGRKRKDVVHDDEDGENQAGEREDIEMHKEGEDEVYRKLTRKEYMLNMGRQSTILAIPIPSSTTSKTISIRIEWKISFDWTGEPENAISIGVVGGKVGGGWPASWRKSDTRNSLARLEGTFERLVKARGPFSAVRGIMGLVGGADD